MMPTTLSLVEARADVVGRLAAAVTGWTAYPLIVEAENRNLVDIGSVEAQRPFLMWDMKFRGGSQSSLGPNPVAQVLGQIFLASKVKDGAGTVASLQLIQHVVPYLEAKQLSVISTHTAEVQDGFPRQGWFFTPVIINFWFHRIVPT